MARFGAKRKPGDEIPSIRGTVARVRAAKNPRDDRLEYLEAVYELLKGIPAHPGEPWGCDMVRRGGCLLLTADDREILSRRDADEDQRQRQAADDGDRGHGEVAGKVATLR